jgi:hypothetical protein
MPLYCRVGYCSTHTEPVRTLTALAESCSVFQAGLAGSAVQRSQTSTGMQPLTSYAALTSACWLRHSGAVSTADSTDNRDGSTAAPPPPHISRCWHLFPSIPCFHFATCGRQKQGASVHKLVVYFVSAGAPLATVRVPKHCTLLQRSGLPE